MGARQTEIEVVQNWYETVGEQDVEAALSLLAADVEWNEPDGFFVSGVYHSPDAVLENVLEPSAQEFETFAVQPDRFLNDGSTVVALGSFRATTHQGEQIESPFAHVWEVDDGQIVRLTNYTDTALWQ
ncbi:nuclear transport factor 2 family protein [Natronococcus wangiae]|uniref:nuclear transport factor 2 family protein n=1 Tax=Natronococcus wangiae TaxID=3068275 RepID=UPI00273DCA9B|nr:nuclear transport factor 2 family protein [Natronococcus sp. AD5]